MRLSGARLIRALAVAALTLVAVAPAAGQRLAGHWVGHWERAGDTMAVALDFARDAASDGYRATFDAERLRVSGIPFNEVRVAGCCDVTLVLRGDRTTMTFGGRIDGDALAGTFSDEDGAGTFAFRRADDEATRFDERDVEFASSGVTLRGTILLPRGRGAPVTGVVFAHGSGPEGRWASRFMAGQLARSGIAALIFDKRGVGESTGDWQRASLDDLAGDVAAAVAALRADPLVDDARVGIYGHSQGGTLAPLFVGRARDVAFVVASAAAGVPTDSTELFSVLNAILPAATSAEDSAHARAYVGALVDVAYNGHPRARLDDAVSAARGRPWYFAPPEPGAGYWAFSEAFADFHPLDAWARVRVPVLLLYGSADQRVPAAESAARIAAALLRAGNGDVTVRVFEGADHTFRMPPGPSGWPVTAAGYVDAITSWLGGR